MIYILATNIDESTSNTIEWLRSLNKKYIRINSLLETPNVCFLSRLNRNSRLSPKSNAKKIDSIWYRKINDFSHIMDLEEKRILKSENRGLIDFLFDEEKYHNVIGTPFKKINKLKILVKANEYGLMIPETIITNSKKDLLKFIKKHKKVITKAVTDIPVQRIRGKLVGAYTKLLDKAFILSLPDNFPTSLFQQYVEKEVELRIFYLQDKLYSMAIFSQRSEKTKIDFRNYDASNPNRIVPFQLPAKIETKLLSFMKAEKFEAASIDMIKSIDGDYCFLEVNPWGQFGMVSYPCNYYLEKKIAEVL